MLLALACIPTVVMLAGIIAAHTETVSPLAGLATSLVGALLGIVAAAALAAWHYRTGVPMFWPALALALAPPALTLVAAASSISHPSINDISTDPSDPPRFVAVANLTENRGADLTFPASNGPIILTHYPEVKTLSIPRSGNLEADACFKVLYDLARERGDWNVVRMDKAARELEGTATTWLFRFRDDFTIRLREDASCFRVDMRSRSRVGRGDLGVNAQRISTYLRGATDRLNSAAAENP